MSCIHKNEEAKGEFFNAETKVYNYKDSCQHLNLSIALELPQGTDSASLQIRDSLIADFIRYTEERDYDEGAEKIKPFDGSYDNPQDLVNYYGKATYDRLLKMAMSDYDMRISYLDEDTTLTEDEKESRKNDVPMWGYQLNIKKLTDTLNIIIYHSQLYCYYGGAHGGVVGTGPMTFSKTSGKKICNFIKADAAATIQPMIRKGLLLYYSELGDNITDEQLTERLQIEGAIIPLPQATPYPNETADSLIFTYGQYEIACYADGMPSFRLAIKDLMPHLTNEGRNLIENAEVQKQNTKLSPR